MPSQRKEKIGAVAPKDHEIFFFFFERGLTLLLKKQKEFYILWFPVCDNAKRQNR